MIKGLKTITSKEIKELVRDPRIILGITVAPLVMFLIMGYAMQGIFTQVEKSIEQIEIGVINLDRGGQGKSLIENLTKLGVDVIELKSASESDIVQQMEKYNLTTLLIIPENFSENTQSHRGMRSRSTGSGPPCRARLICPRRLPRLGRPPSETHKAIDFDNGSGNGRAKIRILVVDITHGIFDERPDDPGSEWWRYAQAQKADRKVIQRWLEKCGLDLWMRILF